MSQMFLLAPPRSCSTVIVAMLGQHPQIYAFPELLLFNAPTLGELIAGSENVLGHPPDWIARQRTGVFRAVAQVHVGNQNPHSIDWAREWLREREHWSPPMLMAYLSDLIYPQVALEKCPETVTRVGALEKCIKAFPDARFIHLTRHPITTVNSMRLSWKHRFDDTDSVAFDELCVKAWLHAHATILRCLRHLPPEKWIRVKAENLLNDSGSTLTETMHRLGFSCNRSILQALTHPERWEFANFGPTEQLYGGDWKFFSQPRMRTTSDPRPRIVDSTWRISEKLLRHVKAMAQALEYIK